MGNVPSTLREKARAAAEAETIQQMKDLLGNEGYARFQTMYKDWSTERMNWHLFTDFWDAGISLTSDQRTALARAMVKAQAAANTSSDVPPPNSRSELSSEDQQRLDSAGGFLSPQQLSFLRERKMSYAQYLRAVRDRDEDEKTSPASSR